MPAAAGPAPALRKITASGTFGGQEANWGPDLVLEETHSGTTGYWHSATHNIPWLQVEFENDEEVSSVTITNRRDCCGERLHDLVVTVGDSPMQVGQLSSNPVCNTFAGPGTNAQEIYIECSTPLTGKYLAFQHRSGGFMHFHGLKINNGMYLCAHIQAYNS